MGKRSTLAWWLSIGLASCAATPPPPLEAPPLETQISCFEGSIRSGPIARQDAPARRADEALSIEFTLVFLERLPRELLTPLPERTDLVMVARGRELLRPISELARRARVGTGESALRLRAGLAAGECGRSATAVRSLGALARGVTLVFSAQYPDELRVPGEGTARRRIAVQVDRSEAASDDELDVALVIEDLAAHPALESERDGSAPGTAPGSRILQREYVLLADRPDLDGSPLAFSLPAPAFGAEAGFLLWVDARSATALGDRGAEHRAAFAEAELELGRARAQVDALASELPQSDLYRRELSGVFEALDLQRYHRAALVFLAGSTGAKFAQDIALVAESEVLAAYVQTVIEQSRGRELRSNDAAGVGWLLERSAYLFATAQLEANTLPPELRACLLSQAGDVGRSNGGLASAIADCSELAAFQARLIEDNWISLEDAQPAARVRAFDWLRKRGQAPANFDPLGTREARRASLQQALDAKEATAPVR